MKIARLFQALIPRPGLSIVLWKLAAAVLLALLLFTAVHHTDIAELARMMTHIQLRSMLPLVLLQGLTLLMSTWLWSRPLSYIGTAPFSGLRHFTEIFRINSAASLMESITPSSKLGGESMKLLLIKQYTGQKASSLLAVMVMHKIIVLLPVILLAGISFTFLPLRHSIVLPIAAPGFYQIALLLAALVVFFVFSPVLVRRIRTLRATVRTSLLAELLAVSLLMWLCYPLKYYLAAAILHISIPFQAVILATLGAYCVSLVPISPGGLGSFELTMAFLLQSSGLSFEEGLLIAGIGRLITFWLPLAVSAAVAASYMCVQPIKA